MGIVTRLNPLGGTLKFYTFKINPTPISATVVINGLGQKSIIAKSGTLIAWRVNLSGYSAQEGVLTLGENTTINLELPQTQYQKLTINPTPLNSTVHINEVEQKEIVLPFASSLNWSVNHIGYLPQSGAIDELIDDLILKINLEKEKYLFSINVIPADADVYINNVLQKSALIPYLGSVDWKVQKYGFAKQIGSEIISENKTLDIELVSVPFYTFLINPIPDNSLVIINGENANSVSLEQNSVVDWSVSKNGFIAQNGILNLTENKVLSISLTRKKFTFQISTTPQDCTIIINGVTCSSISVDFETKVIYTVEKQGYKSVSGEETILSDMTKNIVLEKELYTLTINPTPPDSVVYINGIEQSSIIVLFETSVSWSVSRIGYVSRTGMLTVIKNTTETIELEKKLFNFSIKSNKENAIISVNGVPYSEKLSLPYGTIINWSVICNGYEPQSGTLTLNDNLELSIVLLKKIFRVTIAPVPSNSVIKINGIEINYIDAEFETEFEYEVSHIGYETLNGRYKVVGDWTLPVALKVLQYTFSINPTPSSASVLINGIAQKSITVNYGSNVTWSTSAVGYASQSGNYTVIEDYCLNVLLSLGYYTVTINPTPAEAGVLVNGISQRAITAVYSTNFNWSVSAQYYVAQSGSEKISQTYTKNVVLAENIVSVSLYDCSANGSPASSQNSSSGDYASWVMGQYKFSTSMITAYTQKTDGIVLGPCKVKMGYSYNGPSGRDFQYRLMYEIVVNNRVNSNTVDGDSAVVVLNDGEKLRRFGMQFVGTSTQFSANLRASCGFSCYKYV